MSRGEFLGVVCSIFNEVVAVAGSHGKTTTTAMIAHILIPTRQATLHLGGEDLTYGNFVYNGKDVFITEACEYRRNIEHIIPDTGIVTNVELDHTDCFKNLDDMKRTFTCFISKAKRNLILWEDVEIDVNNKQANLVKVGFGAFADIKAFKIKETKTGYVFHLRNRENYIGRFILNVCGDYNLKNVLCAVATCLQMGVSYQDTYKGLKTFTGVKRRNEFIGSVRNVPIISDYAHHPTQVLSSIKNIKAKYKKVLCIFQPHTYSRTKGLMKEFSSCFSGVNELVIFKTYPAREKKDNLGSEKALYKKVRGVKVNHLALSNKILFEILDSDIEKFKAVLVLGAGDIHEIAKKYVKQRKSLDESCSTVYNYNARKN